MSLERSLIETPMYDGEGHLAFPWVKKFSQIGEPTPTSPLAYGTRAQRKLADKSVIPNGSLWFETDTGLTYRMSFDLTGPAANWLYYRGSLKRTQAQLAALNFGASDDGALVEVTDYRHTLRWNAGTPGFEWAPGEDGRHDIVGLPVDPDDTTGWQLCDGTATHYLKGDGTIVSFTTPNLTTNPAYLKFGAAVTGINAATAPTFSGASISTDATGITITGNDSDVGVNVTTGAGNNVALRPHTHPITDPHHTHTLTGGTVGSAGQPQNIVLRPWFRK